jgi:hypothetical protein
MDDFEKRERRNNFPASTFNHQKECLTSLDGHINAIYCPDNSFFGEEVNAQIFNFQ